MIKVVVLCGRPMHLSPRAAEEWLREEVGKLLADGLLGIRPSVVVANDERSVVLAERRA